MDIGAVTAKKFSNGYGVSGKSPYDGVFASAVKFRAPSFSSSFEDYCEIFGGSEASLGSSIPVLEVPELNETKFSHDIQRSKLDYSKVFGGFGNLDAAVPYEELFAEPKRKDSSSKGALSPGKGANQSSKEHSSNCSKEIPLVSQESSLNGAKKINMSYHKINQGSEDRKNGTTHIAQLHAIPAYTCLIEEVSPLMLNRDDKSIPVLQHAYPGSDSKEGAKESRHCTKSVSDPSPDSAMKQSLNDGVKIQDRSDSIHMFFDACEDSHGSVSATKQSSNGGVKVKDRSDSINMFFNTCEVSHGSDGTDYIKVPTSQTVEGNLNNYGHAVQSMTTKCQVSKSDASEVAGGADSPLHLDDLVDSNSEAAASVAALRKAIEEAQERLKFAKDLMRRKKEGFPDRVKWRFNNDLKAKGKKEDKLAYKTVRQEETNMGQTSGEMDALPQMSSVIGKPMMRAEQVTLDIGAQEIFVAKEAVSEALEKPKSTVAEHKEVNHKEAVFELKDAGNDKEMLYTVDDYHWNEKNVGKNVIENLEESHQTIEVVEEPCEQEANKGNVSAGNEAGVCEEFGDEKMLRCEEVDNTKLAQEQLDYGAKDKNLKVEVDRAVTDNKVVPFLEQEDCERKLSEQGLSMGNENKITCEPEDEEKVEGHCDQEECSRNLRDDQALIVLKKKVTQVQIESKEVAEVFSHLKQCALRDFMEPIGNNKLFNMHDLDLVSMERQMENLGCIEEGIQKNEAGFLDLNQEIEHHFQSENTENRSDNIFVQEILGHVDDEEGVLEIMTKDSDLVGNERVQDAKEDEMEFKGATYLKEENVKRKSESVELMKVTENDPNYEEKNSEEAGRTTEISPDYDPDEGGNLCKIQVADTNVECDKIPEVTPEGYSHNEQDDVMAASNASLQHEEKYNKPESGKEMNDLGDKHPLETSTLAQGDLELNQAMNQMQYANETVSFDSDATSIGEANEKVEQNQDDCLKEAENNCNLAMLVEEPSPELVDIYKYTKEAEDAFNAEMDENPCDFSDEEILVDNESNMEASQPPRMPECNSSTFDDPEIKRTHSNLKESHQATIRMEEKKGNDTSQKVEPETDHLKKIDEAKERQREKEKEKIAVERAIREARERAFAEARERAAVERAATEARRKNISDGRDRLGKTTGQANERTSTERAAMEAKLKAERAAVERATAEARARALERAMSEKAASEARNKSDKYFAEKSFGASRDNGMRPNFHSKSFSYGDTFDGANCESAQRCKARLERHQRIGERVAKALAEKNARDRLVQKEQEERNRVAEALDADVKRWSSGKEGNLRALLSTLQYILGPDSGWRPIHLTDIVNAKAVKKAYRKATLFVHPDKLQQRGASIQQKYTCEKVFDLLKEAWNKFNMEER